MKTKRYAIEINKFLFAGFVSFAFVIAMIATAAASDDRDLTWQELKQEFFDQTEILDGSAFLKIEAPKRAHDAAIVPVKVTVDPAKKIKRMVLFVDENPIPMAADFSFGPASASASFSTRVRVNAYSYVRIIAQTDDDRYHMVKTFVKASGGCAAPANKDLAAAQAQLGKMKLRLFKAKAEASVNKASSGTHEAQIMIRHPNNSGFQKDQVTLLYIPAHYVELIEVRKGDDLVMKVEGGISLSENPNLRFFYRETGQGDIHVHAADNDEGVFERSWPIAGS